MSSKGSVSLVFQRYRSCRLLIDETKWVTIPPSISNNNNDGDCTNNNNHCGILLYISFAETANREIVNTVTDICINLPILTTGLWGDGISEQLSIRQILLQQQQQEKKIMDTSITIVPQANLISKIKSQGKSIQYHGQISKESGEELYSYFVDRIRASIYDEIIDNDQQPLWYSTWKDKRFAAPVQNQTVLDPSIPETEVFRKQTDKYGSFDETGIPLTDAESGEPLTKSAIKKLRKQYEAHAKKHTKWKEKYPNNGGPIPSTEDESDAKDNNNNNETMTIIDWDKLLVNHCPVIAGSFGKRQGLEMESEMGPFCHIINV